MKRISQEILGSAHEKHLAGYQKIKLFGAAILGLLLLAVLAVALRRSIFAFPLTGAAVLVHLFGFRRASKVYTAELNRDNILFTTARTIGATELEPESGAGITTKTLQNAQMIPFEEDKKSQPGIYNGITGQAGDKKVTVCDVVLPETFSLRERGKKRVFQNCGSWIHVELGDADKDRAYNFRILHDGVIPTPIQQAFFGNKRSLEKVLASKLGLSADYYVFRGTQEGDPEAKLPTEKFAHRFADLQNYTTGETAVSVRGNVMDVFIRNRFLAMPVSVKEKPDEKWLTFDPLPELAKVLELADLL